MPRGFVTRFIFLAALALLMPSPATYSQQQAGSQETAQDMTVGLAPGDTLDAHFLDFPEANSIRLTVSPEGTLFVPYAGQVKVQGLMPEEAERAVAEALEAKQVVRSAQVSFSVVSARNLSVMVIGAVAVPHQVPLFAPAPLSLILSQAGPISTLANYHILVAHRDGAPPNDVELDRTGMNMRGMNTMVRPGDIVSVVTAGSFFALGEFNKPGIYPIVGTQHMTLMQAISVAGGPDLYAGLSRARILREVDGHREEIIVDLAKLHDGKVADPLIQTDDIVFIPRSTGKVIMNSWLNQSLYALSAVDVVKNY
jgi:polysaccharide biosynthesis/export protein